MSRAEDSAFYQPFLQLEKLEGVSAEERRNVTKLATEIIMGEVLPAFQELNRRVCHSQYVQAWQVITQLNLISATESARGAANFSKHLLDDA